MTCPSCLAPLDPGARFCGACGKAFSPTESQPGRPAAPVAPEMVGREIAGRYRIVAKLGEGGMGAVFRAEQISLKRAVALKVLRPEMSNNATLLRRFNAEAELVAKLSHPNTVNIYDFGQDADGALFIAMELIEGGSLRAVLRDAGPLPPARALAIAAQLAASLGDAHAHGIIHRDLKPDNVMLQERGKEHDVVRVLDFGIAKLRDDSRATQQQMTQAGDLLGTPQYMAPEQIRGEAIDGRTDVYALGCLLYEMLTARMPFEGTTVMALLSKHLTEPVVPPSQRRPDLALSPALDELVLAGMHKVSSARPPTMEAYGERIGALLRAYQPAAMASARIAPMGYAGFEERPVAPPPEPAIAAPPAPPSIPLGYAGVTVSTGAAVGGLAAARAAAGPTEMVDALPRPQIVRGPNGLVTMVPGRARGGNRGLVLALVGIGVVGALAAGAVVYRARQAEPVAEVHDARVAAAAEPTLDAAVAADPWGSAADPWANHARTGPKGEPDDDDGDDADDAPAPKHAPPPRPAVKAAPAPIPSTGMAVPAGAHLIPPLGGTVVADLPNSLHVADPAHATDFAMGALIGGTNDPTALGNDWARRHPNVKLVRVDKMYSAGAMRPALIFTGAVNGVPITQLAALYITRSYRLGVIVSAPIAAFADQTFVGELDNFFRNNVVLP